jgi:hypothetical protein
MAYHIMHVLAHSLFQTLCMQPALGCCSSRHVFLPVYLSVSDVGQQLNWIPMPCTGCQPVLGCVG